MMSIDVSNGTDAERLKLVYFNARGRAEVIRLLLADAEVPYDDVRFADGPRAMEEFNHYKQVGQLPFGQVPIIAYKGKVLAQSSAILRYLARLYKYMGDTDEESAVIDMIVCGVEDLKLRFAKSVAAFTGDTRAQMDTKREMILPSEFLETTLPQWAGYLDSLLKEDSVWFCHRFSVADLAVFEAFHSFWEINHDFMDWNKFPKLAKHYSAVMERPQILNWLAKRPPTSV